MYSMSNLSRYDAIAKGIARLLHPFAEVVLHDIEENRIFSIHNSFSKRQKGEDSLIRDREGLERGPDVHGPFIQRDSPHPSIKYVSIKLKDDHGQAIGLLCINLDLSAISDLQRNLASLLTTTEDSSSLDSLFDDDWQERITAFVRESLQGHGRSLGSLSRDDRVGLVAELRNAGAFRAKNAHSFVANVLKVSRATIYKDLAAGTDNDP